ncbi:MAG: Na/Pi cotransporter family protein [Clostridia bacterium]|nr:Na/Pi cotransporter family protein [Clostridia bacterium]
MDIFSILTLFGGLALFLFGMNYMGAGLEKLSGGKLERMLEKLTDNPVKGVLLGAVVTAIIQSSSATTVMVVGFVNSGIMKLTQAIGIIMGANIGTTATAWILSLSSLDGDAWYIKLLKPDSFSPIAALIGVVMIMASKNDKKKDIGSILVGFAILMYGMSSMSDAVAPLADMPEFGKILLIFNNPVLGVLAGAVLTAIIQSSSASVGILQALSATGLLPYSTAMPIIMGQNIGTCVTAILSSIGATRNAKRAACVHLYFNLIGTVIFLIGYYTLDAIIGFPFADDMITSRGIATIHTTFNLITTALLLPFYKFLGKLATLTVKDAPAKDAPAPLLDERFLATPSFALEQCSNTAQGMAELSHGIVLRSLNLIDSYDEKEAAFIIEKEDEVDNYEDQLGTYLVKLSSRDLSLEDSKTASRLLHNIGDFERISDHAVNIQEAAKEMRDKNITFSPEAQRELAVVREAMREILQLTLESFQTNNLQLAARIEPLEQVIDDLIDQVRENHIRRLQGGRCTIELGFVLADLLTNFERVSDHCSNLAACMIKSDEQSYETHKYLNEVKAPGNAAFAGEFSAYAAKYTL